jgi:hypothetical protein
MHIGKSVRCRDGSRRLGDYCQGPSLHEMLELRIVKTLIQSDARRTKRVHAAYCQ